MHVYVSCLHYITLYLAIIHVENDKFTIVDYNLLRLVLELDLYPFRSDYEHTHMTYTL